MKSAISLGAAAAVLLLGSGTAAAKTHLRSDELKILAASSVQVVYVDTDLALGPYLDSSHHAVGIGLPTMILADQLNQRQMNGFMARLTPYRAILDEASIAEADRTLVQDTLTSVPWLQKTPWRRVKPAPGQVFVRKQTQQAKAQVVIFIAPRLLMSENTRQLLLICSVDIDTASPPGSNNIGHYDNSEFTVSLDLKPEDLPPLGRPQGKDEEDEDYRLAQLFADDGAAFKKLLAKLTPGVQEKLSYYFTGVDTPVVAAATP